MSEIRQAPSPGPRTATRRASGVDSSMSPLSSSGVPAGTVRSSRIRRRSAAQRSRWSGSSAAALFTSTLRPVRVSGSLAAVATDLPAVYERCEDEHRSCAGGGHRPDDRRDRIPDPGSDVDVERWTGEWHADHPSGEADVLTSLVAGTGGDLVPDPAAEQRVRCR